jgi:hypothetical protein
MYSQTILYLKRSFKLRLAFESKKVTLKTMPFRESSHAILNDIG